MCSSSRRHRILEEFTVLRTEILDQYECYVAEIYDDAIRVSTKDAAAAG
jgi:hypothetical protein